MSRRSGNQRSCNRELRSLKDRIEKIEKVTWIALALVLVQELILCLWIAREHSPLPLNWFLIDLALIVFHLALLALFIRACRILGPKGPKRKKAHRRYEPRRKRGSFIFSLSPLTYLA